MFYVTNKYLKFCLDLKYFSRAILHNSLFSNFIENYLRHLSIDCYFWKSIFDPHTLNRFPNGLRSNSWWATEKSRISVTLSTLSRIFSYFVSSLFGLVKSYLLGTKTSETETKYDINMTYDFFEK